MRKGLRHVWRIQLREAKGGLAKLTVLLLRMRQPFHQAVLVNVLDTATAFARMKQGLGIASFSSAYPAGVHVSASILPISYIGGILRIVHDVWRQTGR